MKRKMISLLISGVIGCSLLFCGATALAQDTIDGLSQTVTVTVVHTNDIHARSAYQKNATVGFDKLKTYIDRENPDVVLDAGDTFHGQAFATLEQGESIAELMKAIGYDAMTPGNHDWNYGKDRLKQLGQISQTPILAGNITEGGQSYFGNDGTLMKTVDGVTIGVFGVFDQEIETSTAPKNVQGLDFSNDAAYANKTAAALRAAGCDIVIALTHQLYCEEFVSEITGVDVLIAGHEHAVFCESYPDAEGKAVTVVETGKYFENVGKLSISYDKEDGQIQSIEEELLNAAEAAALPSDPEVSGLIQAINLRQQQQLAKAIGNTAYPLDGRWENLRIGETALGRVVTAAYLEETGADIAFENAGGIRIGRLLPAGAITYQDIIDISPFGNGIVTKQITGKAVLSILEKSIDIGIRNQASYAEWVETGSDQVRWPDDNGNYLQFGGITATYDKNQPSGKRVVSVSVGGVPLDLDQTYTIATNNYLSLGKAFPELADVPERNQYSACDEALIRFVEGGEDQVNAAAQKAGIQEVSEEIVPDPKPEPDPEQDSHPSANEDQAGATQTELPCPPKTGDAAQWPILVIGLCEVALMAFAVRQRRI